MYDDIYIYSVQNALEQIKNSKLQMGFYRLKFYTKDGKLAQEKTDTLSEFYLYPSGGTLRDSNFNIVLYDSRFDKYKGFIKPKKH
ncbi:MAG: hypothetical protein N3A61_09445 [Ignavibacteria bacterium]|nr:hypothetical protein [Ignavibacteria bacterium]